MRIEKCNFCGAKIVDDNLYLINNNAIYLLKINSNGLFSVIKEKK